MADTLRIDKPTVDQVNRVLKKIEKKLASTEAAANTAAGIASGSPVYVVPPTGLTLQSLNQYILAPDGTIIPRIRVSWVSSLGTAQSEPTASYEIQIKGFLLNNDPDGFMEDDEQLGTDPDGEFYGLEWVSVSTVESDVNELFIRDVVAGEIYDVRIRAVSEGGETSVWVTANDHIVVGKNDAPAAPSGLTARAAFDFIHLSWVNPQEYDLRHIEIWRATVNDRSQASYLAGVQSDSYQDGGFSETGPFYYWIRAVDNSGNISDWHPADANSGVEGTPNLMGATDIADFAVSASKMFTKIPVLEGEAWTNNSPSAGFVAWNEHKIYYDGVVYTIAAGNTDKMFIYWVNAASSYSVSDTHPKAVMVPGDFIICMNISGTHDPAWNAIANQVIGTAHIMNGSITNALIGAFIQSDNWDGINGWNINKSGSANFQSITIRDSSGNIILTSGNQFAASIANANQDWNDISGAGRPADNATVNNVYEQASAPAADEVGDLWYDTTNNSLKRWNGTAWTLVGTPSQVYYQTTAPSSGMLAEDLWFDTDDNDKLYRYNGSAWIPVLGAFSNLDQITPANVSTYIASVAIGTAQIANLAVNTLQIAGYAVTIPTSAYTAGNLDLTIYNQNIQTVTFTATGNPVFITASFKASGFSGDLFYFELYRDSTLIYNGGGLKLPTGVGAIPIAFNITDTPSAASHTYDLRARENGGDYVVVSLRSLMCLEVKK